jgi:antagonist of KipI
MSIDVLAGGLQTTVQDGGRFGYRHLGVGISGALDNYSLQVGNWLVGNRENSAVLEIALQGPRLRFELPARIAITGADTDVRANGIPIPGWRPIDLPAGCELSLGACRRGARAYLAVAGGLQVQAIMGSASTDLRGGFGGLDGRCLAAGDELLTGAGAEISASTPAIAPWWINAEPDLDWSNPNVVRILPGHDAIKAGMTLDSGSYRVSAQSNRQGLRLQGVPLTIADRKDRLSEPVAPGTVQLPPDGQPIILLAEAQTIGGYPRIGHVVSADLPRLAQLRPGDALGFEMVDAPTAHALACAQRQRLTRIALAIEQRQRES